MSDIENKKIAKRIEEACIDLGLNKKDAWDVGFHMTDWIEDQIALAELYRNIETANNDDIQSVLMRYLAHVSEHVAAAKKLIGVGSVVDVFEVGIHDQESDNILLKIKDFER